MKLEIIRFSENNKQTLAKFVVFDEYNCQVLQGYILELPDNNNESNISRINEGEYDCVKRYSRKYGDHFHVLNVFDRNYILIHHGNYHSDTRGCLLPGDRLVDINGDGLKDVVNSKKTMRALNDTMDEQFKLVIKNQFL